MLSRRYATVFVLGIFGFFQAWASSVKVYSIESQRGAETSLCSASLIKLSQRECRLVTAYHCVGGGDASSKSDVRLFFGDNKTSVSTPPIRKSQTLDLAELDGSAEALQLACRTLNPVELFDVSKATHGAYSYLATGFVNSQKQNRFSWDRDWADGTAAFSRTDLYAFGSQPNEWTLSISNLHITPGMSGGSVATQSKWVGIVSQFIPYQNVSFIVPNSVIVEFLNHDSSSSHAVKTKTKLVTGNHLLQAGGNVMTGGGGNSHADGEDWRDLRFRGRTPLTMFLEPDEGIPDPSVSDHILLGLGLEQVDGYDDWVIKKELDPKARPIQRKKDGYVDVSLRQAIMQRLEGTYFSVGGNSGGGPGPRLKSQDLIYREDELSPEGFKVIMESEGHVPTVVSVNSEQKQIIFTFSDGTFVSRSTNQKHLSESQKLIFAYRFSEDSKTIFLDSSDGSLQCDNRHYLKLVCIGSNMNLSVSLTNTRERLLSFRISTLKTIHQSETVRYRFGNLQMPMRLQK